MSNITKGIAASDGVSLCSAYVLVEPAFNIDKTNNANPEIELANYQQAVANTKQQLINIKEVANKTIGEEKAAVFEAHVQLADDPEISQAVAQMINEQKVSAAFAVETIYDQYHNTFRQMEDAYFKERAADILDVKKRLLSNILHVDLPNIFAIKQEVIIVANDLAPSQTALLDKKYVKGFITQLGGRTSHSAIMARTLEIPAIVGVNECTSLIKTGDLIGMDGATGEIEINPTNKNTWVDKQSHYLQQKEELKSFINANSVTTDNHTVKLEANIGRPEDVNKALANGAEGIGLFRSEFLYMDNDHWPTEQEQYEAYKKVLEDMGEKEVIIRTLDIGGDKKLPYYTFEEEMNPFLGYRAIRFCLDNKEIFKTQLRALGRASVYGSLWIMFPMIATIDEFKEAKAFALSVFEQLKNEGHKVADNIKIGAMVEIPSIAIAADLFAKYCDFFSIGTNDLNQYSFACDRMSKKVAYLYQPNNPSLLRLVKTTIAGGHLHNKITGMCGEMAGDIMSVPLLLGLGLDAFSMSATSIPKARRLISKLNYKECQELANQAILCDSINDVNELVNSFLKQRNLM
ncbi:MAG: phosphoenolpyruvate--protein phosphotransferase [Mycoplasmataceae bacterium]|nr:phosphoenolpyruvate--protein phosphotransferase [Mycoplasmataceae bacterium]